MTFGEFIKNFRKINTMTQKQFAEKAGISDAIISMLERGINSNNHKPITPSMETVAAIAKAADIPLDELLRVVDSFPIKIKEQPAPPAPDLSKEEAQLLAYYRSMNRAGRTVLMAAAEGFASSSIYQADNPGDAAVSS